MGAEGPQVLWARSSDMLATLGEDHKASPIFFSTMYILRECEVPATAAQPAWCIPGPVPLGKEPCGGGQFESDP